MPYLRQKPGGALIRIGTSKAPLLTRPRDTTGAGSTGTTGTAALALEDGALLADADGAVITFSAA